MRTISDDGLEAVAEEEEPFYPRPYADFAGVMTVGWGHVIRAGERFTFLTEDDGRELLRLDVADAERAVNALVRVPLTQDQFDALVSLTFNIGAAERGFAGSTLLHLLNAGDYAGAADQFGMWVRYTDKKDGKRKDSPTLIARRSRERARFLREAPAAAPRDYTQNVQPAAVVTLRRRGGDPPPDAA